MRRLGIVPLMCAASALGAQSAPVSPRAGVPAWLFPLAPGKPGAARPDSIVPLRLAGSSRTFTRAQIADLFTEIDWYPSSHPAMPAVVGVGRRPQVFACGYCHLPAGGGRPENSSLAGLPADYIARQVLEFKTGVRRNAKAAPHPPWDNMRRAAMNATDDEIARAAAYFSALTLPRRVRVIEADRVPRTHSVGSLRAVSPGRRDEPLAGRIIEVAADHERHERRDERVGYIAWVPKGSIARGRTLADDGVGGAAECESCHGPSLRGGGLGPPLAGQYPGYLMRQLVAFRSGARSGPMSASMRDMTADLSNDDMVALSAYIGSLSPRPD